MKRNSSCASSFFCFPSVKKPHCIGLLSKAALKLPVFWSSRKLTSLRRTCASALPPLTIFHSLSALQRWHHCTHMRHRLQQSRRHCISAQHRRAGMTRPPALPPCLLRASAPRKEFCLVRVTAAVLQLPLWVACHAHREWRLQYARHTARVRNALYSTACCARQPLHPPPPPPHESNRMQHEARRRLQTPPVPCAQQQKRFVIFEFHKTKSAKSVHCLSAAACGWGQRHSRFELFPPTAAIPRSPGDRRSFPRKHSACHIFESGGCE